MNSKAEDVHFLQIWLRPRTAHAAPSYEQRSYKELKGKKGIFKLISGRAGSETVYIDQDAEFYIGHLGSEKAKMALRDKRGLYVYLLDGKLKVGGIWLEKGDSAEVTDVKQVDIESQKESRFVVLDVPL